MINHNDLFDELGLPSSPQKQKKKLLELTIQLTEDYKSTIVVQEGDSPQELAQKFCQKHRLKPEAQDIIANNIIENLLEKENQSSTQNQISYSHDDKQFNNTLFDRLHNDAIKKKERQDKLIMEEHNRYNKQPLNKNGKQNNISHSNYLYTRGMKAKQEKERIIEEQKQKQEQEKLKQYSFKPQLSQNTLTIIQQKRVRTPNQAPEHHLIQEGQKLKQKKSLALYKKENEQPSFQPQINKISSRIVEQKAKRSITTYVKPKSPQKKEEEHFDFKPKINKNNRNYIPFLERMQVAQQNKVRRQEESNCSFDFPKKPKIGRASKLDRNKDNLPIWDYLFLQQKKKTQEEISYYEENDTSITPHLTTERSTILVSNMRRQKLEEYFLMLDSDNDGFISTENCDLESLPTEALEILSPLFQEMEVLGVQINMETWVDHALDFVQGLSIADKNQLFKKNQKCKSKSIQDKNQFNPKINQNSQRIAQQVRNYNGGEGLYEHYQMEQQQKELRRQQIIKMQILKEQEQCTFQPRINQQ